MFVFLTIALALVALVALVFSRHFYDSRNPWFAESGIAASGAATAISRRDTAG